MTDVKWIKIVTDIFDDEKMLLIDSLPDHDAIIVIWFKLLCLAGKQNNSGVFIMNSRIPFTDEMLATIFRRPVNTVRLALKTFESYGMVEIVDNVITIPNWEKHQTLDAAEQRRDYMKKYMNDRRKKQRGIIENGAVNLTDVNTLTTVSTGEVEEEREEEKEGEGERNTTLSATEAEKSPAVPFEKIKTLYNTICVSFPRIKSIDGERRKAVGARWNKCKTLDVFEELFTICEQSDFLKGQNERNWTADFDWMMKANNFTKILEHKYDNKQTEKSTTGLSGVFATLQRLHEEAGNDEAGSD